MTPFGGGSLLPRRRVRRARYSARYVAQLGNHYLRGFAGETLQTVDGPVDFLQVGRPTVGDDDFRVAGVEDARPSACNSSKSFSPGLQTDVLDGDVFARFSPERRIMSAARSAMPHRLAHVQQEDLRLPRPSAPA